MEEEKPKPKRPVFEGFNPSFKGYSQLPNEWLDEIISQIDNVAELKIVLYVYRHTWGFQEKKSSPDEPAKHDEIKHITTDEFAHGRKRKDGTRMDNGTGLGLTAVKDGIAKAIKHGYIICETDNRDLARIKKFYGLKMQFSDGRNPTTDSHNPTSNDRNPTTGSANSDYRSEKNTVEENLGKESKKGDAHSSILSFDSLEKVREFAELYGDSDTAIHQEMAQRIYQRYAINDDDFYSYLIEAYAASSKTKRMTVFFEKLQEMLEDNFKKR